MQEVGGSNPLSPTKQVDLEARTREVAQPGSASAWGAGGRRFKSSLPDQDSRGDGLVLAHTFGLIMWSFVAHQTLGISKLRDIFKSESFREPFTAICGNEFCKVLCRHVGASG